MYNLVELEVLCLSKQQRNVFSDSSWQAELTLPLPQTPQKEDEKEETISWHTRMDG